MTKKELQEGIARNGGSAGKQKYRVVLRTYPRRNSPAHNKRHTYFNDLDEARTFMDETKVSDKQDITLEKYDSELGDYKYIMKNGGVVSAYFDEGLSFLNW